MCKRSFLRVSSENFLSFNLAKVSALCLNPKLEPAFSKMLYAGFNKSK